MKNKDVIKALKFGISESIETIENLRSNLTNLEAQLAKFDQPDPKIKDLIEYAKNIEAQLKQLHMYSNYSDGKIREEHPLYN